MATKKTTKKTVTKKTVKKTVKGKVTKKVTKKTVVKTVSKSIKKSVKKVTSVTLKVGANAPQFTMPSTEGGTISLKELLGSRVVLYFYPKDMTPGCTVEAHEFSVIAKQFRKQGTMVFGVSPDSIESHHKFIKKDKITFPLLSDEGHKVAEAYGIWVKKSMYGREYMGIERATFVIGKDGRLEQVYRKVSPEGHAVCVLTDMGK